MSLSMISTLRSSAQTVLPRVGSFVDSIPSATVNLLSVKAIRGYLPKRCFARSIPITQAVIDKPSVERVVKTLTPPGQASLFPSIPALNPLSYVSILNKKLPAGFLFLFPLFYAYLLSHYKSTHLYNINIHINALSERRVVTFAFGSEGKEYRFALAIQAGRPWQALSIDQISEGIANSNSASKSTSFVQIQSGIPLNRTMDGIKRLLWPISLLIWKRHENHVIYNIKILDKDLSILPHIASFTLPHAKNERLRIVQSSSEADSLEVPVLLGENLEKMNKVCTTQLQVSIDDPGLSESH